jgi:hypothetical protein
MPTARAFWLAGLLLLGAADHSAAQEPRPQEASPAKELAPPLNPEWLAGVDDNKLFPDFRGKAPDEINPKEQQEYDAYCDALLKASITSEKAFSNSARENDTATFGHLFGEPWAYRGKVVTIKGQLKRLREWTPPRAVFKQGVEKYYEGWVYADTSGSNPVCVMVAEVPPEIKPGDWIDHPVTFHGYFFKKYIYFTAKDQRVTLLCVGRTLVPSARPARTESVGQSTGFITGIFSFIAGVLLLVLLLHWWLNRGDVRVRTRMARLKAAQPWQGPGEEPPRENGSPPQERTIHPNGN